MPRRALRIERPLDEVWGHLQAVDSWEGIGGLHDLRDPAHDDDGALTAFSFSLTTPLGTIRDRAMVHPTITSTNHSMQVRAEAKGIEVLVDLRLVADGPATEGEISLAANGTSFLTRPLAGTLRQVLESGIDRERDRMMKRLEAP